MMSPTAPSSLFRDDDDDDDDNDNQIHHFLINQPFTPISQDIHQIDGGGQEGLFNKIEEEEEDDDDQIDQYLIDDNQMDQYLIGEPLAPVAEGINRTDGEQEEAYNKIDAEEEDENQVDQYLIDGGQFDEINAEEVEMDIEEPEGDCQADQDLIVEPLNRGEEKKQQIDDNSSMDCSSMDSARNDHHKNPHTSTPVLSEANGASKLVLPREDNSMGNGSVNAQFGKAFDEIGINQYKKEDVSCGGMNAAVNNRAHLEGMADRKRLIEPVNFKLDATQIAESSTLPELTEQNKRPAIICSFFAKGWCIKGNSCRFLHIRDGIASEGKESVAVAAQQKCERPLGKDSSLAEDLALIDGEILKQKNEVSGLLKGGHGFHAFPGHETWPISYVGQPLLSLSTSWKRDPSPIQKSLDSDSVYQASETSYFQHYSLPSSGSGLQNHPTTKQSAENKNISFGNWEPSIPFRPSHIITQRILFNGKRFDATRGSREQTHMRDKVLQCGQEISGERNNIHEKVHSKEIQKHSSKIQSVNAETSAERQKSTLRTGKDSSLNSIQSRNIVGEDLVDDNGSEPCTDRQSHTAQPKIECVRQDNGTHVGRNSDANEHKESKELKIFHAALVERVKELLRQPWHDGILSKDVYKLIVKKTVAKVIRTMEPHQIPDTTESIKQYFSLFSGKHTKLVEAYVDKYGGKSLPG